MRPSGGQGRRPRGPAMLGASARTAPRRAVRGRTPERPRIRAARRRAAVAKAALAATGALIFGTALFFARISFAGHPKRPPTPLAAPDHFVEIVHQNLLDAGIIGPTDAPADVATSVS